ncbi:MULTISPECIES: hypothetical protein [Miniimonas]|nr:MULTISPECIES: hypothetical protein [Miniimonas]
MRDERGGDGPGLFVTLAAVLLVLGATSVALSRRRRTRGGAS